MEDIDAKRYVESLIELHATVVMINTSGIIASYPTALPFHTQSAYLHGDDLATIIAACHEADIKVIARTDFSKVRRPLFEQHPEWAYRRRDGEIVDEHGDVHVCVLSEYQQDCAPRIVEETITVLDVDGIFFNMAGFQTFDYRGVDHGICHCGGCVRGFRAMSGADLPEVVDIDDSVSRRYLEFQRQTLRDAKRRLDELIRRLRPDLAIDRPSDDLGGFVRQESNTALDRALPEWHYSASSNTKWVVSSLPRTVSSNSAVDFVDYPVRHVAVSPHRQRLRLAQSLASGGGLDYYVIGRLDGRADRSGIAAVREIFGFHAAHEDDYRALRSCASIALLTGPHGNREEFMGWFRLLAEQHFLFDVLTVDAIDDERTARYRALVLPDLQPLSDSVAERLDRFVGGGGTLVASGRPGFRTDALDPRDGTALACLGLERIEAIREARGAYLQLDEREGFPRMHDTDLVFLDGIYVDARYHPAAQPLLRLIPPGPFGPPERCVLPSPTGEPGLVVNPFGAGRALYLPWLCGALVHRHGHANTSSFLADVLEHHAGLEPVGGNLSPMVEVTLLERPNGSRLLHLVNGSGHAGVGYVEPVTMHGVEVVVPYDGEPADVVGLVSGRKLDWSAANGGLTVRVPELRAFEAIRIASGQERS
jgi:hypothetical protein